MIDIGATSASLGGDRGGDRGGAVETLELLAWGVCTALITFIESWARWRAGGKVWIVVW